MAPSDSQPVSPLRIALWSPKGAGLHYGGPGMSAYRLYRNAEPGRLLISLVHGWPQQEAYDLFESQHFLAPVTLKPVDQLRFLSKARRWLSAHASSFDLFHGIAGYHLTVRPACRAEQLGLPAVVKLAAHRTDLANKGDWKAMFSFHRRRRAMMGGHVRRTAAGLTR